MNSDLVGKVVNIGSRCAAFVTRDFDGHLSALDDDSSVLESIKAARDEIARSFEARDFARAMREVMLLADLVNQYIDRRKPWVLAKDPAAKAELAAVCGTGLRAFRLLMVYLKPVVPTLVDAAEQFLRCGPLNWASLDETFGDCTIGPFTPLMNRIEKTKLEAMVEASKQQETAVQAASAPTAAATAPAVENPTISIDEFAKVDLRIARVVEARPVEGADKLVQLLLDVGECGQRTVFAGIKAAYAPEALTGRLVVLVANLAPRKMRFGLSEGMVLAASGTESGVFLLKADDGATPGMRVK